MGENTKTWPFKLISLFFSLSSPLIPAGDRGEKGAKARNGKEIIIFFDGGKEKKADQAITDQTNAIFTKKHLFKKGQK